VVLHEDSAGLWRELTFLNTRVLTGSVAMGKVGEKPQQTCMVEKSSHYVV
jgi:hypothetical protein